MNRKLFLKFGVFPIKKYCLFLSKAKLNFMTKGNFIVPKAINEPIYSYAPNTKVRELLISEFQKMNSEITEVPLYIGNEKIYTDNTKPIHPPHNHKKIVGYYHIGTSNDVRDAIANALESRKMWSQMPWEHRASIFLKMADLAATKYRYKLNAATMIGQGKNCMQAEIDAACEFIDFLRFNVQFMTEIYDEQPVSSEFIWNRMEYRPLEGFLFASTPFNFTAIAGNLPTCMALMGNVVVWKPSDKQMLSAKILMDLFHEAGLPAGVINLVQGNPAEITEICLSHPDFSGIHFTGSTSVFKNFWTQIGNNIKTYKTYPRIVGETGGKDFIVAHPSANPKQVSVGILRGAFEYQGQKCSAASRAYIPANIWEEVKSQLIEGVNSFKMGSPEDFSNFINAVISKDSFDKCKGYIERAITSNDAEIIAGGNCDDSEGYFVQPTVILTSNPHYESMEEEIFGPIITIYVYDENEWYKTLELVDNTSDYALTGAIFSTDRNAIVEATNALQNSAGNFYINDKPTGAVVGQQPFGGARASGTNDKAGSKLNLLRWVSMRTIKENFVTPEEYGYPFLG